MDGQKKSLKFCLFIIIYRYRINYIIFLFYPIRITLSDLGIRDIYLD
jgi:hypothetical protein